MIDRFEPMPFLSCCFWRWGVRLGLVILGVGGGLARSQPINPAPPKHQPYQLLLEPLTDPPIRPLPVGPPQTRTLEADSPVDNEGDPCEFWSLQVEQPQTLRLTATSSEGDPRIKLWNTPAVFQDPPLAENDDMSGSSDALLDYQLLPGQTYYVGVSVRFPGEAAGSYTLTATPFTPPAPRPLPWDEPVAGHLGPQSASLQGQYCDVWTFSVPEPRVVLVALEETEKAQLNVFVGPPEKGKTAQRYGKPSIRQRIEAKPGVDYRVAVLALEQEADYQLRLGAYTPPPLPPTTPLSVPGTAEGELTDQDLVFLDQPCDVWQIEVEEGQKLTVTCSSEDTDPWMAVFDIPDFVILPDAPRSVRAVALDDDSGGGTTARLSFEAEPACVYYLLVLGYGLGTYQVQVEAAPLPPLKELPWGQEVASVLPEGPEIWELKTPAAGVVTVQMKSREFDSFVAIKARRSSSQVLAEDDDSGGDLNATVSFLAEAHRTYYVQAQRSEVADLAGGGNYTLEATLTEIIPAQSLSLGTPVHGTVAGAPTVGGQSWTFKAPATQRVLLRLSQLQFSPRIIVRLGGPAGRIIAESARSQVVFQAEAGAFYYIQIGMGEEPPPEENEAMEEEEAPAPAEG